MFRQFLSVILLLGIVTLSTAEVMPAGLRLGIAMQANEVEGVLITQVYERSPAESIGLRVGNVIQAIDGKMYDDPNRVKEYVMGSKSDRINIVYQDGVDFVQVKAKLVSKEINVERVLTGGEPGVRRVIVSKEIVQEWQVESRSKVANPRK